MADRPIIFSGPMVRALIDGRKTQTRRVMKPYDKIPGTFRSLYKPGDRLWVRENILQTLASRSDPSGEWESYWTNEKFEYCADDPAPVKRHLHPNRYNSPFMQLRPSIHMPRRASRLTLIVEDVRVQRLQDISEPDVWAEGLSINPGPPGYAQEEFAALWNSLHGPEAWDANPFVAALTFRVERANINTL